MARSLLARLRMSNRIRATQLALAAVPARAATVAAVEGVPTEMGDRRAISIFAMFALDEPEDAGEAAGVEDGIVAFLPEVCRSSRSRT